MNEIEERVAELRDLTARLEVEGLDRDEIARLAARCAELAATIVDQAERLVRRGAPDG